MQGLSLHDRQWSCCGDQVLRDSAWKEEKTQLLWLHRRRWRCRKRSKCEDSARNTERQQGLCFHRRLKNYRSGLTTEDSTRKEECGNLWLRQRHYSCRLGLDVGYSTRKEERKQLLGLHARLRSCWRDPILRDFAGRKKQGQGATFQHATMARFQA